MMFVTGPAFAGKRAYVCQLKAWDTNQLAHHAICDVQELALEQDLLELAQRLSTHEVVIASELGGGVVPLSAQQRAQREAAGRLACLLAERADCVVRICCGLPQVLKGTPS